jgi:hypothetical protein
MLALLLAGFLATQPSTDLLLLAHSPDGNLLPNGWRLRPVSRVPAPDFSIGGTDAQRTLRIEGRGAAAWAYRELDRPLAADSGRLQWTWRVLEHPQAADLANKASDDSPLRIYVVFGEPTIFGPARMIFYSWSSQDTAAPRLSFESDRIAIFPVDGGGDPADGWHSESVDPFHDYRRFWGGDTPPIRVVGIMQDTDATGQQASAELRTLSWQERLPPTD